MGDDNALCTYYYYDAQYAHFQTYLWLMLVQISPRCHQTYFIRAFKILILDASGIYNLFTYFAICLFYFLEWS